MSLQVWLPLIDDYENYGFSDLKFTPVSSNTSQKSYGKIGSNCYYNDSDTAGGLLSNTTLKSVGNKVSMFAWIRLENYKTNPIGIGGTHTILGSNYPTATGMGLNVVESTDGSRRRVVSVNTGNGTNTRTWNVYNGYTEIPLSTWCHIGFTYDGTNIVIYVNGYIDTIYEYTGQSNPADYVHVFSWSRDGTLPRPTIFSNYKPICRINDFRIYDNVVSPKEVKEISMGLVAHWQLKDLTNSRVLDCSGHGNHGIKAGSLSIATDSPRYNNSYVFNGSSYIACGRGAMVREAITVSCWGYMDNWGDYSNRRMVSCTESGGWNLEPSGENANNGMCFAVGTGTSSCTYLTAVSDIACKDLSSGWHMFTGTYDGRVAKIYIDGVHRGTSSSLTSTTPIIYNSENGVFIGAEAGASASTAGGSYFNGKISDVRIYGTALMSSDISKLYNVSSSLDPDGKLFAYEFVEDSNSNIGKNGVVSSGGFSDKTVPTYDMKIKSLDDGSIWARIHYLDVSQDQTFFANGSEVAKCIDKSNRYSRMGIVDKYKCGNEYEFMLTYPTIKKALPSEYTQLKYIEATGTQWVNTGVSTDARWEFDIQFNPTDSRQLMGYSGNAWMYWGARNATSYEIEGREIAGVTVGKRHTIVHDFPNKTLTIQNVSTKIETSSAANGTYALFSLGAAGYYCNAKLYRCKCVQGNSLIRDFIPAMRNSDGYVGLYDIVNNVFYGNSGSGSFVAGSTSGYQHVDYIESTGTQYIDTGYSASEGFKADIIFEYTTLTGNYIVGSHNLSSPYGRNGVGLNGNLNWEIGTGDTCPAGSTAVTAGTKYNLKFSSVKGDSYLDVNGTRVVSTTDSTLRSSANLLVFYNQYSANVGATTAYARLYKLKIYSNTGVLVRDYTPCVNSIGEAGLYDLVEGKFYGNVGTGKFVSDGASVPLYNRWIQTSSPTATSVTGFKPIFTSWTAHNSGIRTHGTSCVYNCDSGDTWYAPIGQTAIWEGGIPAADGTMQKQTELWVRTDRLTTNETQLRIYDRFITAADYMET